MTLSFVDGEYVICRPAEDIDIRHEIDEAPLSESAGEIVYDIETGERAYMESGTPYIYLNEAVPGIDNAPSLDSLSTNVITRNPVIYIDANG